ncbi:hypothetical protein JCM11641_000372 [Rhodosporidiobolus odoratus]
MSSIRPRPPLWSQPISHRPHVPSNPFRTLAFIVLFNSGIFLTFGLLMLLLPLRLVRQTRPAYARIGKGAFGSLLVLMVQWFAPTEMVISAGEGVQHTNWLELDKGGQVRALNLPDKGVWIANHSTLVDWIYDWTFAYVSGHHDSLYIALKSSLRRIPIIGWAAELFNFIFLDRKWETDRQNFRHQLGRIARTTMDGGEGEKAAVLIFPEGTITTENTQGISARYAEKTGTTDYKHLLIPRSTGLFYSLRHLALTLPNLTLLDLTIAYPVPRQSPSAPDYLFPSSYYDIVPVLLHGISPPELHIHLRAYPLSDIPLGDIERLRADPEAECTEQEREAFEKWLEARWVGKDELLERFRREGSFNTNRASASSQPKRLCEGLRRRREAAESSSDDEEEDEDERRPGEYSWRPRLREWWEPFYAFSFFLPLVVSVALWRYRGTIAGGMVVWLSRLGLRGKGKMGEQSCGCGNGVS